MSTNRQLVAIMFTDIVGYTVMMQRDEKLAVRSVKQLQSVIENAVPGHEGELIQYYGDGSLSIFSSATNAVKSAISIQRQLAENVPLRIGIHVGEVLRDGERVFGGDEDGFDVVNITPGVKIRPSDDSSFQIGLGVSLPLTSDREFHAMPVLSAFWHF